MLKHQNEFATATMSRVLGVSRSGFYAWLSRRHHPCFLRHRQQCIDTHVANAFNADKGRSGAIRVALALEKQGIHYNRKTVALSLQRQGLRAKAARKFKATTQSAYSGAIRTPIPALPGQSFRDKPDTDSAINQPF